MLLWPLAACDHLRRLGSTFNTLVSITPSWLIAVPMDEKSLRSTQSSTNGRTFFVANPSDSESDEQHQQTVSQHNKIESPQAVSSNISQKKDRIKQQQQQQQDVSFSLFSPKQSRPSVAHSNAPTRPLPVPTPLTTNLPPSYIPYNSSRSNPTLSSPSSTSSPAIESTPPPSTPGLSAPSIYEQGDKDRNEASVGNLFSRVKDKFRRGTKGMTNSQVSVGTFIATIIANVTTQSPTTTTPETESFTSASSVSTIGLASKVVSPSEKHLIMVTIDCDNYAAVDIGNAVDAAYIRERIFAKVTFFALY